MYTAHLKCNINNFNFKNYFHCSNTKLTRFAFHFQTCASIIQIRSMQRWIFELDVLGTTTIGSGKLADSKASALNYTFFPILAHCQKD